MRFLSLLIIALLGGTPARALITIGDDPAFLAPPVNGAPWNYVAQIGGHSGSAVYLGNGYLLTANHVGLGSGSTPVFLNNAYYDLDPSFGSGGTQTLAQGVDLKLIKILGNPGLEPLQMTSASDVDLGQASTLIGWGKGKGTEVPGQGWYWGTPATGVQRYGTNDTLPFTGTSPNGQVYLITDFDLGAGASEAHLAVFDSGSGLFQKQGNVWKLAGIGVGVDTDGQAFYDSSTSNPGLQPESSYFLRMETYRAEILGIASVPEPSSGLSLLLGAGVFAGWSRRARR